VLELRLFGTGQASYSGDPLPGFPQKQPYHLFCYLLLNRHQPHAREHLAAVFWGEYTTSTSRKYLRNALWRVRSLLHSAGVPPDEYLVVGDDSVSFSPQGSYSLDIEDFESTAARYQQVRGQDLVEVEAVQLAGAVDLYTNHLLTGVYEDWCLYERERLNLLYLNTLGKLMTFHELNGTYEQGLSFGRRILASDNTREKVHRAMMRLYWQAGNRGSALAQYQLCAQILREALGVAPLEETTRLHQQMKYGQFKPGVWVDDSDQFPVASPSNQSALVAAEQALQRLHHLQTTIEQAGTELRRVELQLIRALAGSWDSTRSGSDKHDTE
jgi:DNA-binding SARP family transcriptional activator